MHLLVIFLSISFKYFSASPCNISLHFLPIFLRSSLFCCWIVDVCTICASFAPRQCLLYLRISLKKWNISFNCWTLLMCQPKYLFQVLYWLSNRAICNQSPIPSEMLVQKKPTWNGNFVKIVSFVPINSLFCSHVFIWKKAQETFSSSILLNVLFTRLFLLLCRPP